MVGQQISAAGDIDDATIQGIYRRCNQLKRWSVVGNAVTDCTKILYIK